MDWSGCQQKIEHFNFCCLASIPSYQTPDRYWNIHEFHPNKIIRHKTKYLTLCAAVLNLHEQSCSEMKIGMPYQMALRFVPISVLPYLGAVSPTRVGWYDRSADLPYHEFWRQVRTYTMKKIVCPPCSLFHSIRDSAWDTQEQLSSPICFLDEGQFVWVLEAVRVWRAQNPEDWFSICQSEQKTPMGLPVSFEQIMKRTLYLLLTRLLDKHCALLIHSDTEQPSRVRFKKERLRKWKLQSGHSYQRPPLRYSTENVLMGHNSGFFVF